MRVLAPENGGRRRAERGAGTRSRGTVLGSRCEVIVMLNQPNAKRIRHSCPLVHTPRLRFVEERVGAPELSNPIDQLSQPERLITGWGNCSRANQLTLNRGMYAGLTDREGFILHRKIYDKRTGPASLAWNMFGLILDVTQEARHSYIQSYSSYPSTPNRQATWS